MIDPYYLKIYETKVGHFEICRYQTLGSGAVCVCVCVSMSQRLQLSYMTHYTQLLTDLSISQNF